MPVIYLLDARFLESPDLASLRPPEILLRSSYSKQSPSLLFPNKGLASSLSIGK